MTDLEKELHALAPRPPSEEFESGLEKALGEAGKLAVKCISEENSATTCFPENSSPMISDFLFRLLLLSGMVAALGLALYLWNPFTSTQFGISQTASTETLPAQDISPLHGVSASSFATFSDQGWKDPETRKTLVNASDEGIITRPGFAPVHRYRYRYLDETIWRHPATNTLILSTTPREEVVLVGLDSY